MPARALAAAFLCLGILVGPIEAKAWGYDGHRIVAAIALKLLPPEKAAALENLLRTSSVNRSFVEASGYADDVLRRTHEFDKWHYVNWPDDSDSASDQECYPNCVLKALSQQISIAKKSDDPNEKALALSWIIHLIGDLHQPLHVADRDGDAGGNGFAVTYVGQEWCGEPPPPGHRPHMQLHKVWDDCLVLTLMEGKSRDDLANEIVGTLSSYQGHPFALGLRRDWAKESHGLARTHAYADLDPGDDIARESAYVQKALPAVREQLLKAGIRLASTIDQTF